MMGDTSNLPLMYGMGGGNMTPDQQQQMQRNMYAMSLMQGMRPQGQPTSSGMGAVGQGLSPILNALMYRQMMQQTPQATPMSSPQAIGTIGAGMSAQPMTGMLPGSTGFAANPSLGTTGQTMPMAAPSGFGVTGATASAPAPGMWDSVKNWMGW